MDGDSITKKTEERLMDGGVCEHCIGKYVIVKDENNEDTEGDTETEGGDSEDTKMMRMIRSRRHTGNRRCYATGRASGDGKSCLCK